MNRQRQLLAGGILDMQAYVGVANMVPIPI